MRHWPEGRPLVVAAAGRGTLVRTNGQRSERKGGDYGEAHRDWDCLILRKGVLELRKRKRKGKDSSSEGTRTGSKREGEKRAALIERKKLRAAFICLRPHPFPRSLHGPLDHPCSAASAGPSRRARWRGTRCELVLVSPSVRLIARSIDACLFS